MDRMKAPPTIDGSAGLTLVEVLIALVVLTVGILAIARILPAGSRSELAARMQTVGCQYANETFEKVRTLPRTDPALSLGRHPATVSTMDAWLADDDMWLARTAILYQLTYAERTDADRLFRYCLARARCPVIAVPPPELAGELRHGRLAWVFWHRPLTPEQILRDQDRPAA